MVRNGPDATIGLMLDAIPTPEDVLGGGLSPEATLVLWALATTRLAGLVALDSIFDRPRLAVGEAAVKRRGTAWVETLITCMWCVGVWVAAGAVVALAATHGSPVAPLFDWCIIGLALAQVAGMLSGVGRG